jgi:hypothetical protein
MTKKSQPSPAFGMTQPAPLQNMSPVKNVPTSQSDKKNKLNPFHVPKKEVDPVEEQLKLHQSIEPPVINPRELFKLKNNTEYIYESDRNKEISAHAKGFFSQFIVEEHELEQDDVSCLDCCIGAENLYIGGKKLEFYERGPKMYRNIGSSVLNEGEKERFLKVYPDGRFVTRDLKTNSLVLLSPNCKILRTIKGEVYYPHTPGAYDKIKSFENKSGDMIMLWRKDSHTIALVNLKEFKIKKEIQNFWTYKDQPLQDQLAICDSNMMNIIGVSEL